MSHSFCNLLVKKVRMKTKMRPLKVSRGSSRRRRKLHLMIKMRKVRRKALRKRMTMTKTRKRMKTLRRKRVTRRMIKMIRKRKMRGTRCQSSSLILRTILGLKAGCH